MGTVETAGGARRLALHPRSDPHSTAACTRQTATQQRPRDRFAAHPNNVKQHDSPICSCSAGPACLRACRHTCRLSNQPKQCRGGPRACVEASMHMHSATTAHRKSLATWPDTVHFLTALQPARQRVTFMLAGAPCLPPTPHYPASRQSAAQLLTCEPRCMFACSAQRLCCLAGWSTLVGRYTDASVLGCTLSNPV